MPEVGHSGEAAVIGLDLGTGGARACVVGFGGDVLARGEHALEATAVQRGADRHEQDPEAWWRAAVRAVRAARTAVPGTEIVAIAVDGTSGTVVGVDASGAPTTPGVMYDDGRTAPSPLSRLEWLRREAPAAFASTAVFVHQADFVAGRLRGCPGTSDGSNALKMGYDPERAGWSSAATRDAEIRSRLPSVVAPGTDLGPMAAAAATACGLDPTTRVIAGVTDGTAGFLASGARRIGDDATTLGTTLVFKRLAGRRVEDPSGRVYCHGLPGGLWIPGAASNTGGGWMGREFAADDLAVLDRAAEDCLPTQCIAYPLVGRGERFPFVHPGAEGFVDPPPRDRIGRYAALLQGTALVEAIGYEVLDALTGTVGRDVFVTGGGSRSDVWVQLRADVTGRTLHRPEHADSAFGTAVLAAAGVRGEPIPSACARMVRIERSFAPDPARVAAFAPLRARLRAAFAHRGYLPAGPHRS